MDKKRRVIGIYFHDNDFSLTVQSFLRVILFVGLNRYNDLSKENIVFLFNKSAPGLYWLAQHRQCDTSRFNPETYLKISVENVYLDGEVEVYIKSQGGNANGEFHVLDTCVHEPFIYEV